LSCTIFIERENIMRNTLAAVLLASIAAGPALAQTAPFSGSPVMGSVAPLATASAGQMLSSDIRGTKVYGANNENIGEVDDILIERDGRVAALIIGVGGFLGIGEKYVAIPMQAFEIALDRSDITASVRGTGTGSGAPGTGTTASGTAAPARSAATTRYGTVDPDHFVLKNMTKADLQNAPAFGRPASGGSGTGTGTGAPSTPAR
jgi:sporulation protein YlmC with PRC-barrel domain